MSGRACGGCTLCCRLVPVEEISKHAGRKCVHQRWGKGCKVYQSVAFPESCARWSCRWLIDPATAALHRPDRSHYVIDEAEDVIREDGVLHHVMQVWCDPHFAHAWRDPALLAYIAAVPKIALIRFNQTDALVIVPPALSKDGAWREHRPTLADNIPGSIHAAMKQAGMALPVLRA